MRLLGPNMGWTEPWSWNKVKTQASEIQKELPPMWRLVLYCFAFPVVWLLAMCYYFPEVPCWKEYGWHILVVVPLVSSFVVILLPYLEALFPRGIRLFDDRITFINGNACTIIKEKQINSLSFRTIDGRRFFVVSVTTRKGEPFEKMIEMPTDGKVTEANVVQFLCDVGLSHLYHNEN